MRDEQQRMLLRPHANQRRAQQEIVREIEGQARLLAENALRLIRPFARIDALELEQ